LLDDTLVLTCESESKHTNMILTSIVQIQTTRDIEKQGL